MNLNHEGNYECIFDIIERLHDNKNQSYFYCCTRAIT